ncbi:DNA replication complex GINS protein PSF2 [Neolamprologus brichardi]|uniref:DNA replication complex GINS protein PSF2 n=1 Tax=Neolamprologus brichardi TaxID=32507 RepID=UPI0003EBC05E|nr:DNA replication complex GINS protein PSF2 [Neolamprologus brichardi]
MDASEVEFLAEKEMVKIIPNFSLDKVFLIGGDLGPFNPGLPIDVPVWLALNLKQRQKCRIIPPEWMDVEKLEEMRDLERKEDMFTPVPSPYYMELTKLLLNHYTPTLGVSKCKFVYHTVLKLDNLTLMEINTIRAFLLDTLNCMYKLRSNLQ